MEEIWKPVEIFTVKRPNGRYKYEVSNLGRVRSTWYYDRDGTWHGIVILRNRVDVDGQYYVLLVDTAGKSYKYLVGLLVACAFKENDSGYCEVLHCNGDLSDNRASNLVWTGAVRPIVVESTEDGAPAKEINMKSRFSYQTIGKKQVVEHESSVSAPSDESIDVKPRRGCREASDSKSDADIKASSGRSAGGRPSKPVRQYAVDLTFVAEHSSASEAARDIGLKSCTQILYCCQRKRGFKTCGGFFWRFPDDDELYEISK